MRALTRIFYVVLLAFLPVPGAFASGIGPHELETGISQWFSTGNGTFAPYYMMSNRFGAVTQRNTYLTGITVGEHLHTSKRFQWSWGVETSFAAQSSARYGLYDKEAEEWTAHKVTPRWFWLQQAFVSVQYRSVFLTAGLKETGSALLSDELSSGDLTWGANARPMPGVRIGLEHFVDVPYTKKWLQVDVNVFIGKPQDDYWLKRHYNYYNYFITTGRWNSYRRLYFRVAPLEKLSVTLGMQAATQICGTQRMYKDGNMIETVRSPFDFDSFVNMLIPRQGDDYYVGNHLGSWDMMARYRLPSGKVLKVYFQWPWEDGSGIGKKNGWDGLWGLEYQSARRSFISGAVIEYLDFTNQSGPLHWDPEDNTGTSLKGEATGADDYYNNYYYNGYAYLGMSQGTPFLRSPIYNTDGYMRFTDTRVKGVHMAVKGYLTNNWSYRIMASWRKSYGDGYIPRVRTVEAVCWMAECDYDLGGLGIVLLKAQVGMDSGRMFGNNFGAGLGLKIRL